MSQEFEKELAEIEERISELTRLNEDPKVEFRTEIAQLRRRALTMKRKLYANLTPWQAVQVARHPQRPLMRDFAAAIFDEFLELHGDRCFGDDAAMVGGFASVGRHRCMLIGMDKGKTVEEKVKANFGMARPEGYRKALRLMRLAEKYGIPIVCLVDTPAAYPGRGAEERGQAEAIARNITEMTQLTTPILVIVTGEGGSGGALGIAVGDVVLMLSYAIYSVIPPEGCAAILWRDADKAPEAAEALKLTAPALLELGVIDGIIEEPLGAAHGDPEATFASTRGAIVKHLVALKKTSIRKLVDRRYEKYVKIGKFDSRKYTIH